MANISHFTQTVNGISTTYDIHDANAVHANDLATVATSGSYNDLSNKPTIPTVNNATLTIQKNGTTVKTFTANASSNVTANITVPTKTSELTNDSGFLTSHQDLSGYIPLSGTNALSGSIVPDTDNAYNLGDSTHGFANIYAKYVLGSYTQKELSLFSSNNKQAPWDYGACISLYTNDYSGDSTRIGTFSIRAQGSGNNTYNLKGTPSGTLTWGTKNVAMQEDVVPRSGGAVMSGPTLWRTANDSYMAFGGGTGWGDGAYIQLNGANLADGTGNIRFIPIGPFGTYKEMHLKPNGTWTWNGTACQITSDQRLKQQISEIDDKLLDAWEHVNLVQFKYNDAVDQKKDKARLHTGYVVQQINSACKSHGVDISAYGLYCHEEYPEETEEVEVEQADGTKVKETKVIREASEHYSLRYTEVYAVECMYLRRENSRLKEKLASLEERLEKLEQSVK